MNTRMTLLAAAATLAFTAAPAAAERFEFGLAVQDFFLRISANDGDRDHYRPYRRHHLRVRPAPVVRPIPVRRWVEGCYVTTPVQVWVEGRYEEIYVPAQYRTETYCGPYGRTYTRTILVREACTQRIWREGYYTTTYERRWIPGHWEDS